MKILGIGSALLDIFWFSDEESALCLGLHPNHSIHINPDRLDELLIGVSTPIYVSGGSASNALKAAAALGADCRFIGCTGTEDRENDTAAKLFRSDLDLSNVRNVTESRNGSTGRCLIVHMPGELKAIACAPGVAQSIRPDQLDPAFFAEADWVLLDGQTLRNEAVTNRVIALCREKNIPLALDVASVDIARSCCETIYSIIVTSQVAVLMNSEEARAFTLKILKTDPDLAKKVAASVDAAENTQAKNLNDIVDILFSALTSTSKTLPCIVEKKGDQGARAWSAGKKSHASTTPILFPIDDTAAGDTFVGAWLCSFGQGMEIEEALNFSNKVASTALFVPGSRLDTEAFFVFKKELEYNQHLRPF